jgi:UDP-3-O-acyl N-acetylglucosamine deacetylase
VKVQSEIPILDGSAIDFCRLLDEAGVQDQDEECAAIVVDRAYQVGNANGEFICVKPADTFSVRYELRYPKPVGTQDYFYRHRGPDSFKEEIAPARTFGFLRDIAQLEKMGLAAGGRLSNFILIDDEKIVNTELRFPDELARHKILDIIGDFYLLGRPIRGAVTARMTGHSDNIALLREIKNTMGL